MEETVMRMMAHLEIRTRRWVLPEDSAEILGRRLRLLPTTKILEIDKTLP
jgi:hypothetical protein